jgi:hypothetical protein
MSSKMLSVNRSTRRSGLMNNWFEKTLIDLFGCFYVALIGEESRIPDLLAASTRNPHSCSLLYRVHVT